MFDRICGRIFSSAGAGTAAATCTYDRPFVIGFHTDDDEVVVGNTELLSETVSTAAIAPAATTPSGIIGFKLDYTQQACP